MSNDTSNVTHKVLMEVAAERGVQRGRWGNVHDDRHTLGFWTTILASYVGRASNEVLQLTFKAPTEEAELRAIPGSFGQLRMALIKVAATAVAWVEAIDRRPRE